MSWETFNESSDLILQVERKSKGIRFSGKPLGRPVKLSEEDMNLLTAKRRQHRADSRLRNQIEGKFG